MNAIPRSEYPRPQFVRKEWICLNGEWTFSFDSGGSGIERKFTESRGFDHRILVPFAPESKLSGIGHTDFIEHCWYQRPLAVPAAWNGMRIILHFGGSDYHTSIFIDNKPAGEHSGGSVPFRFDITPFVQPGSEHNLVVYVRDFGRSRLQPMGKQSDRHGSYGCCYTRTTGLWRTVWLEALPENGLLECRIIPDLDNGAFSFVPLFASSRTGIRFHVRVLEQGRVAGEAEAPASDGIPLIVPLTKPRVWSPESPALYDIELQVLDNGRMVDRVTSYAGLRKIHCEGNRYFLNNRPLYCRFVLDQGFYPDGIWTAPTDEALKKDIALSLSAGFNGARLHQKVFDARFHYWADTLGYLTWAEFPDWGMDSENPAAIRNLIAEWTENVIALRNHPSIIAWTPLNETLGGRKKPSEDHSRLQREVYAITRQLDATRPVNTASGYTHAGPTDLWAVHHYEQDGLRLKEILTPGEKGVFVNFPELELPYAGQPYFVDEFGGIQWIPDPAHRNAENSWGYAKRQPESLEDFYVSLEVLVRALNSLPHLSGWCYTQLTDVEQEQNGVYFYDRSGKFDIERIRKIFSEEPRG